MDIIENKKFNFNRHPWEISRAFCILELLKNKSPDLTYADIGAGDLYFTSLLKDISSNTIYAVDKNFETLECPSKKIAKLSSLELIPENSINVITLLDVLEHVEDESAFINSVLKLLKPDGEIIITIPAHQFLFSNHDKFMSNYRRYNQKQIISLLSNNGLSIKTCHYFYTTLFFIRCIQKLLEVLHLSSKKSYGISKWPFKTESLTTRLLKKILDYDFRINTTLYKYKIILTGLSLCVICKRKSY